MALAENKPWPDPRYFAAAPTRAQAKRIFWKDLKDLVPGNWVKRVYETDLCIVTRSGSELWVVGLDKPQRIEGTPWDGGVLDEYANMKPTAWTENIRPALSDRKGWCWFIGVPEGLNHYRELAEYARSGVDGDWGFYSWHSKDIIDREEIEAARRHLDPRTFRQEYEGSFEAASGRVYYAYSREKHEDGSIRFDPHRPIIVCCDFNVRVSVWELLQIRGGLVEVFDEIVQRDTNTVEMAKELLRRYGPYKKNIIVYGDASGRNRSTAGKSDYALLFEMGLKNQRIKRANPSVKDRINALNSMLETATGRVRLTHHPRCTMLRKDFESLRWRGEADEPDKSDMELTHATDALGYFIEKEFPLRVERFDRRKRFYK